ncbi:MAG TPA: prephenate dehydrogenase [Streptosporangiaceae bacterium]|nr:prephenate dehydrogenase [Streptosporangiaceae bacterium]
MTAPASVIVVGTGLIGTSVALALRPRGVTVWLADSDPAAARLAADIGAGTVLPGDVPGGPPPGGPADVAVLAVPPQAVAPTLARAQAAGLARWYTDVASVKALPVRQARAAGCDMASFVPGHPLSGRERSGPAAARADLFLGRPWVICPDPPAPAAGLAAIEALARACGAEPVQVSAAEHDRWVALVSHAPHVLSAAMAARLADASDGALSLAGQGLRDVTRIAAGDTSLWTQILAANAAPVADVLAAVAADLAAVADALADTVPADTALAGTVPTGTVLAGTVLAGTAAAGPGDPDLKVLAALLEQGGTGVSRIPGKQGGPARAEAAVQVVIPDRPGELARLFQAAGEAGVNIEDIAIEHSPGLPVGVAELTVHPEAVGRLTEALAANGWPVRR